MQFEIKQYWSENFDRWFYYVVFKRLFKRRLKWTDGSYTVFMDKDGDMLAVSNKGDRTHYFETADEAQEYVFERYAKNAKTVRIIQID